MPSGLVWSVAMDKEAGQDHQRDERAALLERTLHNMTLHPPTQVAGARMDDLRRQFKQTAGVVIAECVPGRELSMALTALEDALMYAIASIARADAEDLA